METILKTAIAALLALGVCACNDDDKQEQPFAGIDNHITSFTLTARDGAVYRAAIVEDEIVVSAPQNVSLDGATADYAICEQAVLYPDPAKITDWDNEHRFRVMAYNQTLRDYAYSVARTEVSSGSVTLLTQSDVAAFAATGATVIEGNLTIGGFAVAGDDPVTDLSALASVTDVRYNIVVNNSFAGERLELAGLRAAGGLLLGTTSTTLATAAEFGVELPALETLGQLSVNSATVSEIGLPKLTVAGNIHINSSGLAALDLTALRECAGDLTILSGTSSSTGNKALTALSLPALEEVAGSLTLQYLTAVETLELPQIASIGGNCTLTYLTAANTLLLPELAHLGGAFAWNYLTKVTTFSAPKLPSAASFSLTDNTSSAMLAGIDLSALESVRGNFLIQTKFSGERFLFPALKSVEGQFKLQNLANLTMLDLPQLTACGSIYLSSLSLLTALDLSKIETLSKIELVACYELATVKVRSDALNDVALNGGSKRCDFTRFEGAQSIAGTLSVSNYTQNEELSFPGIRTIGTYTQSGGKSGGVVTLSFPDLETIGSLKLSSCTWLKTLDAPKLAEVTTLWDTSFMQYVTAGDLKIPSLRRIGEFKFTGGTYSSAYNNMQLTSMDDFAGVTQIGKVSVNGWGKLADFTGLKNAVPSLADGNWSVLNCAYNPTWQDMLDGKYTN